MADWWNIIHRIYNADSIGEISSRIDYEYNQSDIQGVEFYKRILEESKAPVEKNM